MKVLLTRKTIAALVGALLFLLTCVLGFGMLLANMPISGLWAVVVLLLLALWGCWGVAYLLSRLTDL